MSKTHDREKPSPSALLAALYRAVGNKEFRNERFGSDYLAECFLPFHVRFIIKSEKIRARGKARHTPNAPGVYEYVLARTMFFDDAFIDALDEAIPQIVLLGAGYDSRAYRFADRNRGSRIIELDNAATQNRKKKCLKKFRIEIPEWVTHVPIDFNQESLHDVLAQAGYEDDKKTLFLWEGVTMYLEPESIDATLKILTDSSNSESVIIFDYIISITDDNRHNYYGAAELIRTLRDSRSIESMRFAIDEENMESFLDQRGLKLVKSLDHRQIEKSFLLGEDGASIGRPNGMFRLAMVSSKG